MPKNAPKTKTLVEVLDALIEKYHLLKHPFYQAWTAGKLSKEFARTLRRAVLSTRSFLSG